MDGDKLRILGMIFHAYHGLGEEERENGQRFEADVELVLDVAKAAQTDRIKDTVDVREVYACVRNVVLNERFFLIEAVSQRIADTLLDTFHIKKVTVRIRKPFAPLGGLANGTEIEITRTRE
jgi:7,8-dihydroneopterin aldolase/epimerase/oxygenase